jgi:hypothetical protein
MCGVTALSVFGTKVVCSRRILQPSLGELL